MALQQVFKSLPLRAPLLLVAATTFACEPLQVGSSGTNDAEGGITSTRGGTDASSSLGGKTGLGGSGTTRGSGGTTTRGSGGTTTRGSGGTTTRGSGTALNTGGTTALGTGGTTVLGTGGTTALGTGGTTDSAGGTTATGTTTIPDCQDGTLAIRGHLLSSRGQPLQGVTVTLSGGASRTTMTDAKGNYAFAALCGGTYTVVPSYAGLRFCVEQATLANLTQNADEDFVGSAQGCLPAEIEQRVAVVVYDPLLTFGDGTAQPLSRVMQWGDPLEQAEQFRRAIATVTNGKIQYSIVARTSVNAFPPKLDGFVYDETSYRACLQDPTTCHSADRADYEAIARELGFCEKVNDGIFDEVWLFGAPYFGFPLLQRFGPAELATTDFPLHGSACQRLGNVFGFNYERGLDAMLAGLSLEADRVISLSYGNRDANSLDTGYNRFSLVDTLSSSYAVSGCGGPDYPPNGTTQGQFDNTASVSSYCDAFYDYPSMGDPVSVAKPVTCEAWGCTGMGYFRYWLGHLPTAKGIGSDGKLANWWRYLLLPDGAMLESDVTCSSSYTSGWCRGITDGVHGECNIGEWATSSRSTGWVEFNWPLGKSVNSVTIYDRACNELMVAGHIEFSDGSDNIPFGPLANTGITPWSIGFDSKSLTWLRVVIDGSQGGPNPGFGEIIVN